VKFAKFDQPFITTAVSTLVTLYGHGIYAQTSVLSRLQIVPATGNWLAGSWVAVLGKKAEEL
jgi:hypothetical protein